MIVPEVDNISDDALLINKNFKVCSRQLIELSPLAQQAAPSMLPRGSGTVVQPVGLGTLATLFWDVKLDKSTGLRRSDWSVELSHLQIGCKYNNTRSQEVDTYLLILIRCSIGLVGVS